MSSRMFRSTVFSVRVAWGLGRKKWRRPVPWLHTRGVFETDFIVRQLQQILDMISRVLGVAERGGDVEECRAELDEQLDKILGKDRALLESEPGTAALAIGDPAKLRMCALLYKARAELNLDEGLRDLLLARELWRSATRLVTLRDDAKVTAELNELIGKCRLD